MRIFTSLAIILCFHSLLFSATPVSYSFIEQKCFIKNQGQVKDQSGIPNSTVRYLYHDRFFNLALKSNGFSYEIFEVVANGNGFDEAGIDYTREGGSIEQGWEQELRSHRIDVVFEGASRNPQIMATHELDANFHFYYAPVTTNQETQVKGYSKVEYRNLYPGIDLVFYAPDEEQETPLRYELIVHPGADPSKIKFRYEGATNLFIDGNGDYQISGSLGAITESKPVSFVESIEECVETAFVSRKNVKSFSVAQYDKRRYLVIDPNIAWGTYYGGEKGDEVTEVSLDSKKKAIVTGNTISTVNMVTSGAHQVQFAGGVYDYFIAKFKTNGKLEWGTYFGGKGKDYSYGVKVDPFDNVIVLGNSTSQGLATPGAFQDSVVGEADMVIVKFSSSGTLIWCTYMGGENPDQIRTADCDKQGFIYIGGTTSSPAGISSPGAFQPGLGGTDDAVIAKFSPGGSRIWSTYFGGTDLDRSHAISLDGLGNVYLGGTAESITGMSTSGTHQPFYGGGETDAFLAKFDTTGDLGWCTYYGGSWADRTRGVGCDEAGNVYLAGFTESDSSIATPGAMQENWTVGYEGLNDRAEDGYLVKFSSSGVRQWGTYYGGDRVEELWGMTIDQKNNDIYVVGSTQSTTKIVYGNAMQSVKSYGEDGFIAKFHLNGTIEWGTYWGGKSGDQFEDVSVDKLGFIYVTGRATSNTILVTPGTYQQNFYGGVSDVILFKFYAGADCFDPFEPNEQMASARLIKAWLPTDSTIYGFNGRITNSSDQDWFKIKMTTAEPNLKIVLNYLTKNYDLKLYNKVGTLIYQSENAGTTPDTIIANSLSGVNYFLQIAHNSGDYDSLGCYHLLTYKSDAIFTEKKSVMLTDGTPNNLTIYPNPVDDLLSIDISSHTDSDGGLIIYDMMSREVYSQKVGFQGGMQQLNISVSGLTSGPYLVVIQQEDNFWTGKFVKR